MVAELSLVIDGKEVKTEAGKTVIQAAMDAGLYIPYLCYYPGMKPYGACRMCVVEIENTRGTPASCTTPAADGMVVWTNTEQIQELRKGITELVISEHPHGCLTCHRIELCGPQDICLRHVSVTDRCVACPKNDRCELKDTTLYVGTGLTTPLDYKYRTLPVESKDPFYDMDYNLCIVCGRCVRACEEIRVDSAIAFTERAGISLVGPAQGSSLLESGLRVLRRLHRRVPRGRAGGVGLQVGEGGGAGVHHLPSLPGGVPAEAGGQQAGQGDPRNPGPGGGGQPRPGLLQG